MGSSFPGTMQAFQVGVSSFADPPELGASHARVLWDPDVCSTVCHARAEDADSGGICLLSLATRSIVLRTPDGTQHVLIENSGRRIQLAIIGTDISRPVRLTTVIPVQGPELAVRLWMAKCLNDLCGKGTLPVGHLPKDARQRRLRAVLQALDGSLAGASHREICCALLGEKRTDADWAAPSEHLRHTISRAIRRGRLLMSGEYKSLLRQL